MPLNKTAVEGPIGIGRTQRWKGKFLGQMTKDELIIALAEAIGWLKTYKKRMEAAENGAKEKNTAN